MTIKYPFSTDGIKWFEEDTINDIMNHLESDNPNDRNEDINDFNIFVTIGNREIIIPLLPECHENTIEFLKKCLGDWDQC